MTITGISDDKSNSNYYNIIVSIDSNIGKVVMLILTTFIVMITYVNIAVMVIIIIIMYWFDLIN